MIFTRANKIILEQLISNTNFTFFAHDFHDFTFSTFVCPS